jgi:hypothetical protein
MVFTNCKLRKFTNYWIAVYAVVVSSVPFFTLIIFQERLLNSVPALQESIHSVRFSTIQPKLNTTIPGDVPLPISNKYFFQNEKAYGCADLRPAHVVDLPDSPAPNDLCLGGKESWGRCGGGQFLCPKEIILPAYPRIKYGNPFSFKCIENICEVHGFRYDPLFTSHLCPNHGICLGCHASQTSEGSDFFCDPLQSATDFSGAPPQVTGEAYMYIPHSPPLNSMRNGRDTVLDHEEDPVNLLAMTWPPEQKCSRVIKQTAILTFLDGINPFHHLVMVFRRVFAALVTFQVNAGVDDLTDCVFVAWRGFEPERYYEKFGRYLEPGTNMTPFDGALVNSISTPAASRSSQTVRDRSAFPGS